MVSVITHGLTSIVSMIILYYLLGYGVSDGLASFLKLNYIDGDKIVYKGKTLSGYDKNCSVIAENKMQLIKLYCDSHLGRKILFAQWERGILYQPPALEK